MDKSETELTSVWLPVPNVGCVCKNCKNWYGSADGKITQAFYDKFRYCPFCGAKMQKMNER